MCLIADSSVKARKSRNTKDGYLVAWKVMTNNFSSLREAGIGLGKIFQYQVGENKSGAENTNAFDATVREDLKDSIKGSHKNNLIMNLLSDIPIADGFRVHYGFHCFLRRDDARQLIKFLSGANLQQDKLPLKVVKVYYKPEDVRAYGKLEWAAGADDYPVQDLPNVVLYKLTIKELKGE